MKPSGGWEKRLGKVCNKASKESRPCARRGPLKGSHAQRWRSRSNVLLWVVFSRTMADTTWGSTVVSASSIFPMLIKMYSSSGSSLATIDCCLTWRLWENRGKSLLRTDFPKLTREGAISSLALEGWYHRKRTAKVARRSPRRGEVS